MGSPRWSIAVPLDNEQGVLPERCARLRATATRLHGPVEIICVNDVSSDGTLGSAGPCSFKDKAIRAVSLSCIWRHRLFDPKAGSSCRSAAAL
jgi:hypothetical protein